MTVIDWDDIDEALELFRREPGYRDDPKLLFKDALEYFKWCNDNPIGEKRRPYTISGFCTRKLFKSELYMTHLRAESKREPLIVKKPELSKVIDWIYSVIEQQQFEGASIGDFKENIIARKLGLVDKQDLTSKGEKIDNPIVSALNKHREDGNTD